MTTKYFILSKQKNDEIPVNNNDDNQLVYLNNRIHYILPQTIITYYSEHGLFEAGLIDWCKQFCKKDKIFLDIGAHTGTYCLSLASSSKYVYSFEPQKMTYYALCGGVALSNINNITCYNFGLGSNEQVGQNTLKIVSNDGGGSSLHAVGQNVLREEEIEIRTLDSLKLHDISFIKMDVEDNELFVLQGGIETLKNCQYPPILFESNGVNEKLFKYITDLGYKIVQVTGVNNMFLACF